MLSQGAHTHTRANTLTHPQRGSIISNRPGLGQREDVSSIFPLQRREQRSVLWRSQQKEFPWTQQCFYSAHFYFFAVLPSHKASFFYFTSLPHFSCVVTRIPWHILFLFGLTTLWYHRLLWWSSIPHSTLSMPILQAQLLKSWLYNCVSIAYNHIYFYSTRPSLCGQKIFS